MYILPRAWRAIPLEASQKLEKKCPRTKGKGFIQQDQHNHPTRPATQLLV
jgi:hypothetical protein